MDEIFDQFMCVNDDLFLTYLSVIHTEFVPRSIIACLGARLHVRSLRS